MKIETQLTVKHELTEQELNEKRSSLVDALSNLQRLENELKTIMNELKGRIAAEKVMLQDLHTTIIQGFVFEKHLAEKRFDEINHQIVYIDIHSGEVLKSEDAPSDLFSQDRIPVGPNDKKIYDDDDDVDDVDFNIHEAVQRGLDEDAKHTGGNVHSMPKEIPLSAGDKVV